MVLFLLLYINSVIFSFAGNESGLNVLKILVILDWCIDISVFL